MASKIDIDRLGTPAVPAGTGYILAILNADTARSARKRARSGYTGNRRLLQAGKMLQNHAICALLRTSPAANTVNTNGFRLSSVQKQYL